MRLPLKPLASFSKEETMISKRDFKAKFEQLSQTRERSYLKHMSQVFLGVVFSNYMGTWVHINSSSKKPCIQYGKYKGHTF